MFGKAIVRGFLGAALVCCAVVAQADVFNMGTGLTNLETVWVANKNNAADPTTGYGAVGYVYQMGKYEVTAAQYTAFLNAVAKTDTYGLYNTAMADSTSGVNGCNIQRSDSSGSYSYSVANDAVNGYWANRPVNYVSFWDTCRFANWLQNGQPTGPQGPGTTETGAYTLNGYMGSDGSWVHRNLGVSWFLPSEDEWYKTAMAGPTASSISRLT